MKKLSALLLVVVVCAGCITGVRAGKRCNTSEWGDDGTYALKCENRRWVRKATKAQVAALLIAIAKAKQVTPPPTSVPAPPPPPPMVLTTSVDGVVGHRWGGRAVHINEAGGWYGIVFQTAPAGWVGAIAHLSAGPNPTFDVVHDGPALQSEFRLVPSGDGTRAAILNNNFSVGMWSLYGDHFPLDTWPTSTTSVICISPEHLVYNNDRWGTVNGLIDATPFVIAGHPVSQPTECSDNGRFVSVHESSDGSANPARAELYDSLTHQFASVYTATDPADDVALSRATPDGGSVGVSTAFGVGGVWSRSTGTIRPVAGFQPGDLLTRLDTAGGRAIGIRATSLTDVEIMQYGSNGSAPLRPKWTSGTELGFNPDLQSGLRLDPDGSLRVVRLDWTAAG